MNSTIFWRLVWKEYRQQRALWVAIALAGLIFQVAMLIYCSLNGVPDLPDKLFTVALSIPALYSLGCGAALFAGEHEAETFPFQQSLPVSAGRVFFAKFAFALLSALLLFPVLWLLAFAMASWRLPDTLWHSQLWGGGVFATVEVLIWAVLGSVVLRRVLPAAVVSGVTATLLGYGSLALMVPFGDLFPRQANEYFSSLPLRICFALIALAIAVKFGRQWFDEHAIRWRLPTAPRTRSSVVMQRAASATPTTGITVLMRLVWHEWRQARITMLCCAVGYVVLGTWMAVSQMGSEAYLGLLPVVATIFGASVFAADQRQGQYQFFTEHGVRPRLVWLSRQLVWGLPLVLIAVFALSLQTFARHLPFYVQSRITASIGFAFLMFSSGQICSLLIRSGIVAVFTAAMCSILLFMWTALMANLGVLWLISAVPLPFIFLFASWLYAPKWIQQRHTWRVRIVTAATIIVPLLCVVAATAAYRVYEIPAIQLSFDPAVPQPDMSPAARKTAAMYQEADQILRRRLTTNSSDDSTEISSRDDEWRKGIELFTAASQRNTCHFHHWYDTEPGAMFDGQQLTRAVLAEAQARIEEGDLEGAAQLHEGLLGLAAHYYQQNYETWYRSKGTAVEQDLLPALPIWANHESLTAQRLHTALSQLQSWSANNHADWETSVREHRLDVQKFIALDDKIMDEYYGINNTTRGAMKTLGTLVPWERWRMSRLLDVYTEAELQGIREIRARGPRIPPQAQLTLPWDVRLTLSDGSPKLIRSSEVEGWFLTTQWLRMTSNLTAPSFVSWERQYQVRRKSVQQQLALIAWRKEHGKLPDSLHHLQGEPYELPLDPYTKQPFVYFHDGVLEEIWEYDEAAEEGTGDMRGESEGMSSMGMGMEMAPMKSRLVRSEPFLWSPGEQLRYVPGPRRGPTVSPVANDFRDQNGRTLSESELLHQGLRYPVPLEKQQPSDPSDDADALPNDE